MKIGIDVRMIFDFPTGIGNYRKSLIKALFEIDKKNNYILIGNSKQSSIFSKQLVAENVVFREIKSKANHPGQHITLRKELKKLNLDLFWTTPWGATLGIPCKYILTIHDLIYHHYPEFGSWKFYLYELLLEKRIATNSEHIVTISDFVKSDIHNYLGIDLENITNIGGSVSSDYGIIEDSSFLESVLQKHGLKNTKYFVYMGNQRPHKNLVNLLKAFEGFKKSVLRQSQDDKTPKDQNDNIDIKLVIIGGVDANGRSADSERIQTQLNSMKYKEDVVLLGKVFDNNEVSAIFNCAIAMVHPSLHEGFGLTPLEAMSCGCPVISSNVTAMPEVVGDAGILIDPQNINSISDAMLEIYSNKELRTVLSNKAVDRSQMFSWEKTARILLSVFTK